VIKRCDVLGGLIHEYHVAAKDQPPRAGLTSRAHGEDTTCPDPGSASAANSD